MQKQNMNWFATLLRVVICFIILTDLTKFSVKVLCGWSVWSRRSRYEEKEERKELKLGDARGTPSKYSRRLKRLSLGMLGRHPLFLQQVSVFYLELYFYSSHIMSFAWSLWYYMSICWFYFFYWNVKRFWNFLHCLSIQIFYFS